MFSKQNIRTLALALVVIVGLATEAQAQRFHGGHSFGASFAGRSYGFRAPSYGFRPGYNGYGRTSWGTLPGYSPSRFSSYGFAGNSPYRYGLGGRDRDFRRWGGFGYYPYGYGWYGYPFLWGYGAAYPYYGDSDPGLAGSPGAIFPSAYSRANDPGSVAAFAEPIDWPLGLRILPGADPLRQRIDRLYEITVARALAGAPTRLLPIRNAVKDLQRLVASDKHERLTLSSEMYEQAEAFLRDLKRSAADFSALDARALPATARSNGK